jgi:hypothetical protein
MLQNLKVQFLNGFNNVDSSVRTGILKQKAVLQHSSAFASNCRL